MVRVMLHIESFLFSSTTAFLAELKEDTNHGNTIECDWPNIM